MTTDILLPARMPAIPGFVVRHFQGATDITGMAGVITAARRSAGLVEVADPGSLAAQYEHLRNSDAERDMTIVELDGRIVAYGRVEWQDRTTGERSIETICNVDPAVRRRGVGTGLFAWQEERIAVLAAAFMAAGVERPLVAVAYTLGNDPGGRTLIDANGYRLARRHCEMSRRDLRDIPAIPLPDGLDVRPIEPGDESLIRRVFEADAEVFAEHWGDSYDVSDEAFARFRADPSQDPRLWRVAFDGDEIAGQILNYLGPVEPDGSRVGWTESIAVRRPWRRRGLARALLALSLRTVRDAGATSAALGVDQENPNQALRLYESLGFRMTAEALEFHRRLAGARA